MRFRIRFPVSVGSHWGKVNSLHLKPFAGEAFIQGCLQMAVPEGSQPQEVPPPRTFQPTTVSAEKKAGKDIGAGRKGQLEVFGMLIGGVRSGVFTADCSSFMCQSLNVMGISQCLEGDFAGTHFYFTFFTCQALIL